MIRWRTSAELGFLYATSLCLALGACPAAGKRALGDLCARDDECTSGRCDELVCKADAPAGAGEPCRHNLECRSEYCVDICARGLRGIGASCSDDLQCYSGHCLARSCAEGQAGDARLDDAGPLDGPMPDAAVANDAQVIVDVEPLDMDTTTSWALRIGSSGHDHGYDLALDGAGNLLVTGRFRQDVDFGGRTLSSEQGLADGFVASYAPDGTLRWCQRFGGPRDDQGRGLAIASDGDVYVIGDVRPSTSSDLFLAGYRAADGGLRWSRSFGGIRDEVGQAIAADDRGNLYITGSFQEAVDFGGGLRSAAGRDDVYLASYAAIDGSHRWSLARGGEYNDYPQDIIVDGSGNLYYTGNFAWTTDYGGGEFLSAGHLDVVIASYLAVDGSHRWSLFFGSTEEDQGHSLVLDRAGNLYGGGMFSGTADLGGGALTAAGIWDAYLVSYSTTGGLHRWSDHFGGTQETWGWDLVVGPAGHLYYSGYFSGSTNLGGDELISAGGHDIFVASFSADGAHRWSQRFGGPLNDLHKGGLAVDAEGSVYLTGVFQQTVDFAGTQLVEAGGGDAFVLKLAGATLP